MTKRIYMFAALVLAMVSCSSQMMEEEVPVNDLSPVTTISATIQPMPLTKTGYTIDMENKKAVFRWVENDQIDAVVNLGSKVYTEVQFGTTESGSSVSFDDSASDPKLATLQAQYPGADLAQWAFYPSRTNALAQLHGYGVEWVVNTSDQITLTIPSQLDFIAGNPLSVVPLLGTKTGAGGYSFAPLTAVLAFTVSGLEADMNFISISYADDAVSKAKLSGGFTVSDGAILQTTAMEGAGHSLRINFSGLEGEQTFYFPVPAGTLPAGLRLKCGNSADEEGQMEKVTTQPIVLTSGRITPCVSIAFAPRDYAWADWGTGTFKDDFLWTYNTGFSALSTVNVTIQRSGTYPNKYRINNPYTVACADASYTPYTVGVESDPYFIFTVADDGTVTYPAFRSGVEDLASSGYPMKLNNSGSNTKVVTSQKSGDIYEIQFGVLYTKYADASYYYTKNNPPVLHLVVDAAETWSDAGTVDFIDNFLWGKDGFTADEYVTVALQTSDLVDGRYRIANPYTAAATHFSHATPVDIAATAQDYLTFSIDDGGLVTFDSFDTGIDFDTSHPMTITHPTEWASHGGTSGSAANNLVTSEAGDGSPLVIQLMPIFHETGNYKEAAPASGGYYYPPNDSRKVYIKFAEPVVPETWTKVAIGTFIDEKLWDLQGWGTTRVPIELYQSSQSATRFRVPNPYLVAKEQFAYSTYSPGIAGDPYLVFSIGAGDAVDFDTFLAGIEDIPSGGKPMKVWYPLDWGSGYTTDAAKNLVSSYRTDGLPEEVELYAIYSDPDNVSYKYTAQGVKRIRLSFPLPAVVTLYGYPLEKNYNGGHNPLALLSMPSGTLTRLVIKLSGVDPSKVEGLRLYQGGWMNSAYVAPDGSGVVTMDTFSNPTVSGDIDINIKLLDDAIGSSIFMDVQEVELDGVPLLVEQDKTIPSHTGVWVNKDGDNVSVRGFGGISAETVNTFRIPALVTSNAGTLIAAYDVRYGGSGDLSADIDVGVKRSTDGGKTWGNLILAMDMDTYGYTPANASEWTAAQRQNGIGDPTLLVDENTGRIFCFAVWAHGHYNDADRRSLAYAGKGYEIADTPQFMMVYSDDDGLTWSEPVNITRQIKRHDWRMTFQGPGRGITMANGTLVIPIQHQEGESKIMHGLYPLHSGIAYSTDHGLTWHTHELAHTVTSECAVAEIAPGTLLLTMRDETDSHTRRNYVTTDMGRTWTKHASDGKLIDATCEASILHVAAADNITGKDLVLFANPMNAGGRSNYHIQASEDGGVTWPHKCRIDIGGGYGYTCLTMIDNATVGILYEYSRANSGIFFQAIPLTSIVQ